MSWQISIATALRLGANALDPTPAPSVTSLTRPAAVPPTLSAIAPEAFYSFVQLAGPIIDAARGQPTLSDAASVAQLIAGVVEMIDPASIPIISLAEDAEPVAAAIFEFAKSAGVKGGVPAAFPAGGGPGQYRSR